MAEESLSNNSGIILFTLKILVTFVSLILFSITAGWLRGSNSILIPVLGVVIATPLLIMLLASIIIALMLVIYACLVLMQ